MRRVIFKYTLLVADEQDVAVPVGARLLTCQEQGGKLVLWAMVDADAARELRTIRIVGTGNPIEVDFPDRHRYIATAQIGALVWHVFEVPS